jgi:prolyl oligopeptidase PreP (S9A serine peptidase family)
MFFDDWSEVEWSRFDNYMINCCQFYLKNGLVKNSFVNLELRKFIAETSKEFYDWANKETLPVNVRLPKDEIYDLLVKDSSDLSKWLRKRTLNKWLKIYADYNNYKVIEGKTNNNYWIEFEAKKGSFENPIKFNI